MDLSGGNHDSTQLQLGLTRKDGESSDQLCLTGRELLNSCYAHVNVLYAGKEFEQKQTVITYDFQTTEQKWEGTSIEKETQITEFEIADKSKECESVRYTH